MIKIFLHFSFEKVLRSSAYSKKYGLGVFFFFVFFFLLHVIPNLRFRQFEYVVCLRSVWMNVSVIKVINFAINKQSNHVHFTIKILSGNVGNRTNKLLFLYIKMLL